VRGRHATWLLLIISVAGCQRSADSARETLSEMSVPFTADAFVARAASGDQRATDAFLEAGIDPNATDAAGATALGRAAAAGQFDIVRRLLDGGANPNTPIPEAPAETPLMLALVAQRFDVAKALVEKGAHSWVQDDKWSPLMMAALLGDRETIDAMLARDANVHAANARGMTALMFAASRGWSGIVEALAANGADVNAQDVNGYTALMFAANNGHPETVRVLLDAGADAAAASAGGETALSCASRNGFIDVVSLLQPVGAATQ
jgi:uncharacterized protein